MSHGVIQKSKNQIPFIILVKTDNTGTSNDDQFTIQTRPGPTYNYTIDTSDGQHITGVAGNHTITFPSAGTYAVKISQQFPYIYYTNTGDKLKIIELNQWGTGLRSSFGGSLFGCSNMVVTATDVPNLTNVTTLGTSFTGCTLANPNMRNWNMSTITVLEWAFASSGVNPDVTLWNTASLTTLARTFSSNTAFNSDISNIKIKLITTMSSMLDNSGMSTENYSKWLISCANQVSAEGMPYNIQLGATGMNYNSTNYGGTPYNDAVSARAYLTGATATWTISGDAAV
jgi:hypothetical protein